MKEISVIMSTYCRNYGNPDCDNYLKRALDSILSQTYRNFELILIDDGSTDGSKQICQEYAARDERIRYFRHDQNSGKPAQRYNEGIASAKGEFIAFMFDDDEWTPNALEDLHKALTSLPSDYGMVFGKVLFHQHGKLGPSALGIDESLKSLFISNTLSNHSVLVRKEVFYSIGGFDESVILRRLCDWDLWLRMARRYKMKGIPTRVGILNEGISNSLVHTAHLNLLLVAFRMGWIFRKIPFKKGLFPSNSSEWKRVGATFFPLAYYTFLRYCYYGKLAFRKILRKLHLTPS